MTTWTKTDRLNAVFAGEKPDRAPVSAYLHQRSAERSAYALISATLTFQQKWDWDWIKLNPRTVHYAEAWGNEYNYDDYPSPLPIPAQSKAVVNTPADAWEIARLDIQQVPEFVEQLEVISRVKAADPETPVFATIYSPLNVFLKIAGLRAWAGDLPTPGSTSTLTIRDYITDDANGLRHALDAIATTLAEYAAAQRAAGADGLFFVEAALTNSDFLTPEIFDEYSRPYDAITLEGAAGLKRVVHTCGSDSHATWFDDFALDGINWDHFDNTNPGLDVALGKVKAAGVSHTLLGGQTDGPLADTISAQVAAARALLDDRFVLAPSCSVPETTTDEALAEYRDAARA